MTDEETIRERAYTLWEQKGRPEGSPEDFWHQARQELESEDSSSSEQQTFTGGIESGVAPPMPRSQNQEDQAE